MCRQGLSFKNWWFCCFSSNCLFSADLRVMSYCKHIIGTLLWLMEKHLKGIPSHHFGKPVRCSTSEHSFVRLKHITNEGIELNPYSINHL